MVKRKQNKFQMNQRITCKKKINHIIENQQKIYLNIYPSFRDFLKLRPYLEKKNRKRKDQQTTKKSFPVLKYNKIRRKITN